MYTFTEITDFKLGDYTPHMGWIGKRYNPYKIYTLDGSGRYYLHDEIENRLFEFTACEKLNYSEIYESVVTAYTLR